MAQAEFDSARETLAVKTSLRKLDAAGDLEVSLARADARRISADGLAAHGFDAAVPRDLLDAHRFGYGRTAIIRNFRNRSHRT